MDKVIIFSLTISLLFAGQTNTIAQDKERNEQFQNTVEIIEQESFIFKAQRAFPQGGRSVDLTTNYGFIEISDDSGEARLPFFGRAYSIPYGGNGGIQFSGTIENVELSRNQEKMRINYSFEVRDRDYYKVNMEISHDGNAYVTIISNNRSQISYQGTVDRNTDP
ncbi:MAG: DUF4251 domain-containing protein [Bacteroidales bacterium]